VTARAGGFAGFAGPGRRRTTNGIPPMALGLGPEEITALRRAVEAYPTLDLSSQDQPIFTEIYGLLRSWERRTG
jgi:hypothetical protein